MTYFTLIQVLHFINAKELWPLNTLKQPDMEEHLQALSVTIYFLNAVPFVALHSKCHNTAAVLFNTYIAGRTTFMLYIYTYIYIYIYGYSVFH